MRFPTHLFVVVGACLLLFVLTYGGPRSDDHVIPYALSDGTNSAIVSHFTLAQMTQSADKIFRATVVDAAEGTLTAGGGELPIVTYRLRVDEAFKGSFPNKDGVRYLELNVLGALKVTPAGGDVGRAAELPTLPPLEIGRDYLLLTTAPSAIGLSTAIGLGQGSFAVATHDPRELTSNEFDNAGLYDGSVPYKRIAADIEELVGRPREVQP